VIGNIALNSCTDHFGEDKMTLPEDGIMQYALPLTVIMSARCNCLN
jgi:hypothetical protein